MSKENQVLNRVEETLAGNELLDQPKAVLLLRLSQFYLLLAPHKAAHYWEMLQKLVKALPLDQATELQDLKTSFEESVPETKKGFTSEMLSEIEGILKQEDKEAIKKQLQDVETRLKKRFNPFGKGPVWKALVETWLTIDRSYAFQLMKNLSTKLQKDMVIQLNKTNPLSQEEWNTLLEAIGDGKGETIILEILGDKEQSVTLDETLIQRVAKRIRNDLPQLTAPINENNIVKLLGQHAHLLGLHSKKVPDTLLADLIAEVIIVFGKASWMDRSWLMRFELISVMFSTAEQMEKKGVQVFTPAFNEKVSSSMPSYLTNFTTSSLLAWSAAKENFSEKFAESLEKTHQDPISEAWFLTTLVKRGFYEEAMQIASTSKHAAELQSRLRRGWLCTHPESAGTIIRPQDMQGDVIGEFLAQGDAHKRAEYLKSVTENGKRSVPGAMWAGTGTEDEKEGVRGFWASMSAHQKSYDEIVQEYLRLNPLYSSYQITTKKEEQFEVELAVNGFGQYKYVDIDNALLAALVVWADQDQAAVHAVLQSMWNAIRPDDNILRLDWLRNNIISRCINVFSADQDMLFQDFLDWFKTELVTKGRQWQVGNQMITLRYPDTAPLQFSLASASAVGSLSAARKDEIIITGLNTFKVNEALIESAAQLYNSGKPILDLHVPTTIKNNYLPNWQNGIVKNALNPILQAVLLDSIQS